METSLTTTAGCAGRGVKRPVSTSSGVASFEPGGQSPAKDAYFEIVSRRIPSRSWISRNEYFARTSARTSACLCGFKTFPISPSLLIKKGGYRPAVLKTTFRLSPQGTCQRGGG